MLRALFEVIIIIIVVMIARAVLTALIKGVVHQGAALRNRPVQNRASASSANESAGELHKDPVCGTYVAQSTPHRRQIGGQTFYYCSEGCREKHALVAR